MDYMQGIIGLDSDLSPVRHKNISLSNAELLLIWTTGKIYWNLNQDKTIIIQKPGFICNIYILNI